MGNQKDEELSQVQQTVHESGRTARRHRKSSLTPKVSQASCERSIRHSTSIPTLSPHPSSLPTPTPTPATISPHSLYPPAPPLLPNPTCTPMSTPSYSSSFQAPWIKAVKKGLISFWISIHSQLKILWPFKIPWFIVKNSWFILLVICSVFYFVHPFSQCHNTSLGFHFCEYWPFKPYNTATNTYIRSGVPKAFEDPESILTYNERIGDGIQTLAQIANAHIGMNYITQYLTATANSLIYQIQELENMHQSPIKAEFKLDEYLIHFQLDILMNMKAFERLPTSLATLVNWAQSST